MNSLLDNKIQWVLTVLCIYCKTSVGMTNPIQMYTTYQCADESKGREKRDIARYCFSSDGGEGGDGEGGDGNGVNICVNPLR